jgi:thiamine biosynthesis lipoprotein
MSGMKLDLGGIAKGYACDKALESLKDSGAKSALLDLGGNIYALGKKPDGSDWKVGVIVPYAGEGGVACSVSVSDRAIVTSGSYQRFFSKDGKTYHHILDPATGYPADNDLLSATIVGPSATDADGFSTACFVIGRASGVALIESVPEYEAIFITKDNKIYVTSGLAGQVQVLDERFRLEET